MSLQPPFLPASVPRNSFSVLIAQPKVTISRCLVFNCAGFVQYTLYSARTASKGREAFPSQVWSKIRM